MEQCTEEEMLIPETELLQLDAYQLTWGEKEDEVHALVLLECLVV